MTDSGPPLVAVVIVNYRSARLIDLNYADLGGPTCLIVVVDNYSDEQERAAIHSLCKDRGYLLVPMPDNLGFGHGANAGADAGLRAGARVLMFANPDASPSSEVVADLADHVLNSPGELTCPRLVDPTGRDPFTGGYVYPRTGRIRNWTSFRLPRHDGTPSIWLTGACLVVSSDAWLALHGFRERYFMYWEDVDLSWRALAAGYSLCVREDLSVRHDQGGTQGGPVSTKSSLYYRYNVRNRLLFAALNLPRRQRLLWLASTPVVAREVVTDAGRRQLLKHPSLVVGAIRGVVGGVALCVRSLPRSR